MKSLVNTILRLTWKYRLGTSLKYRLKGGSNNYKIVGWSIVLYKTKNILKQQTWVRILFLSWFTKEIKDSRIVMSGIADPFLIVRNNRLYLFYEAIINRKGELWCAELRNKVLIDHKSVINESFHLSYPNVFNYCNEFYMIPESSAEESVRLYKSNVFPFKWDLVNKLKIGHKLVDTNLLIMDSIFFWFTYDLEINKSRLYFSNKLNGEWTEHPHSPFECNRNAGTFICHKNLILRPIQISKYSYGEGVALMELKVLSIEEFIEVEYLNPFIQKNNGFCLDGTHHISSVEYENEFIIAVDGKNHNYYSSN